jgi:hypothetical protein
MQELHRTLQSFGSAAPGPSGDWSGQAHAIVTAQVERIAAAHLTLDTTMATTTTELDAQRAAAASLVDRLRSVLPSWLRDILSPDEALRLYPPVMVTLMVLMGVLGVRMYRTEVAVRSGSAHESIDLSDLADASTWSFLRSTRSARAMTTVMAVGAIVLLWWLFEVGVGIARRMSEVDVELTRAIPLTGADTLPFVTAVGRAAYFASLVVVVVITWRGARLVAAQAHRGSDPGTPRSST